MPTRILTQYQQKAEPPAQSVQPGQSNAAPWLYRWSEPVRIKPGLNAALQQSYTMDPSWIPNPARQLEGWYNWWSEPVRQKPGLGAANQAFFFYETEFPEDMDVDWYRPFSEPVRFKQGLRPDLQQFLAYHPRILPTPNVTGVMAATETNTDVFLGAINVYSGGSSTTSGGQASVSVVESGPGGDGISIVES
jgi:hypothetical protein